MAYDPRPMYEINAARQDEIKAPSKPRTKWASEVLAASESKPMGRKSPLLEEYERKLKWNQESNK